MMRFEIVRRSVPLDPGCGRGREIGLWGREASLVPRGRLIDSEEDDRRASSGSLSPTTTSFDLLSRFVSSQPSNDGQAFAQISVRHLEQQELDFSRAHIIKL